MRLQQLVLVIAILTIGLAGWRSPAVLAAPPPAATLAVSNSRVPCVRGAYTHIQDAVNAAVAGDTIRVCPGTYTEQVTIPASKNGLTLTAVGYQTAVIKAPALLSAPKAIVHVAGASGVTIQRFTITGPGSGSCDSLEYGVLVDNGGAALIQYNHITKIQDTPLSDCTTGVGILVGRFSEAQIGRATISENQIDTYQKGGIVVSNTGSSAEVDGNEVHGVGPTAIIVQNGIQVSDGAAARVQNNIITDNTFTPQSLTATGILLYASNHGTVLTNDVQRSDVGIFTLLVENPVIRDNRATGGAFDGFDLISTLGARVSGNEAEANQMFGFFLADASTNMLTGNAANDNGVDGFEVDGSASNNILDGNQAHGNPQVDCRDASSGSGTAATANTWTNNAGQTSSPPGICAPGQEGQPGRVGSHAVKQHPAPQPSR